MDEKTGVARLRQAITNQATCGNGQFELSIDSADRLCREIEDEITRFAWAKGVPAPVDADGEAVPLDTDELYTDEGETIRVASICLNGRLWYVRRAYCDETYWLDELHLNRPDGWERLEEDIERMAPGGGFLSECYYFDEKGLECSECPARGSGSCSRCVACDVMRRAKALAERDVKEADRG